MKRRVLPYLTILLLLFALFSFGLSFCILQVKASGTIYIRANGSIDPHTALISSLDNETYTFTGNIDDSIVVERNNIVVDGAGYTVQGTRSYMSKGIYLNGARNVTIQNVTIKEFDFGIYLYKSSGYNCIVGNNITSNWVGIVLDFSSINKISGNNITENDFDGMWLETSSNYNIIVENNITANKGHGIWLSGYSNHNSISGNNITSNKYLGIFLVSSSYNNIVGNNIRANKLDGIWPNGFSNNNSISENNITENHNGIYIYGSSNNNVNENNITENNGDGISLESSSKNNISGNSVTENKGNGIYFYDSPNNNIDRNNVTNNAFSGITLIRSSFNNVSRSNIANSWIGIIFESSSNNNMVGNKITASEWSGIWLNSSSNNCIYQNDFVGNTRQVYDPSWDHPEKPFSINTWDDGYPCGGNYWSDYEQRYPNATEMDDSDIWDTPYVIDSNNIDNYPIVPEFPSFLILPLFMIATLLAVIAYRKKKSC